MVPFFNKKPVTPDAQMELVEHLDELRTRLIRCIAYLIVGMTIAWFVGDPVYNFLKHPVVKAVPNLQLIQDGIQKPFLQYMQVSFVTGILLAFPVIVLELWGFIAPALTPDERKPVLFLAPFSVLLFAAGVGTGYASLPAAFQWMASFLREDTKLLQNSQEYLLLVVKILLGFGISFQLPIVLLFLARIGLVNARMMTQYWRQAVVVIFSASAILTPGTDPLSLIMMAVPMTGLYLLSINLVKAFEPRPDGTRAISFATMLTVALAPVAILAAVGYWLWRTHGV